MKDTLQDLSKGLLREPSQNPSQNPSQDPSQVPLQDVLQDMGILMAVKSLSLSIDKAFARGGLPDDLTASQGFLLVYIWNYHRQGTFVTDLHRELGLSKATISVLTKKLRAKGYLSVAETAEDDRQKKLVMTEKLRGMGLALTQRIGQANRRIYGDMSRAERETLQGLLCRLMIGAKNESDKEEPEHDNVKNDPAV